ncbi:MAG: DUF308 domain-containing protein [Lachnospiraceae bacterium]|nr:DUF308 domain-containing protein [Lachnospiraceae bacterium]
MKNLKDNMGNLLTSLCELIIGILLLINPTGFTSFVIIVIGVVLLLRGILNVISYFRTNPEEAAREHSLAGGVILLAIGLFCIFCTNWFLVTFPMLTFLYGVIILLAGLMKIQWVVDCLRLKKKQWLLELISAALSLICGIVIITNPFTSTAVLWTFAAVSLIVEAILDFASVLFGGKKQ